MSGFNVPSKLVLASGNVSENWKNFEQALHIYLSASNLDTQPDKRLKNVLLNLIGDDAVKVYNNFKLTVEEDTFQGIIKKFTEYCNPKKNILYARYLFNVRKQEENEMFDSFVTEVQRLAKNCEYTDPDEIIRDKVVFDASDDVTKMKIIEEENDISLDNVIKKFRLAELTKSRVKDIVKSNASTEVYEIKGKNPYRRSFSKQPNSSRNGKMNDDVTTTYVYCSWCGYKHSADRLSCPAKGKRCNKCNGLNHFANVCRNKYLSRAKVHVVQDAEKEGEEDYYCDAISNVINNKKVNSVDLITWVEKLKVENSMVEFKLDSGSDVNVISKNEFENLKRFSRRNLGELIKISNVKLSAYNGTEVKTLGSIKLYIKVKERMWLENFVIVKNDLTPILGLETCVKLGMITRNEVHELKQSISGREQILRNNSDIFSGIGSFPEPYTIRMKENVEPRSSPPYRVPLKVRDKLKKKLDGMCKAGIISEMKPTGWVNRVVIPEKPNGDLRICLDPKDLNVAIAKDYFEIPTISDLKAKISKAKVFSVLDLKESFWQIKLDEKSREYCTFSTVFGTYCFNRLPYGLSISAEVFQKYNEKYFGDIEGVFIYIDDILIYAETKETHDQILNEVMQRAREINVKFNAEKFQYCIKNVKYLGHCFGQGTVKPDVDKVQTILDYDTPSDKKSLQRFLGLVNYLGAYIPCLSEVSAPIRHLLKENVEFVWTESIHGKCFDKLKELLTADNTLATFEPQQPITIQTDSSKSAIGSVLLQNNRPVSYASKSLSESEMNYGQIDKEFLAILFACKKYHHYIYGRKIIIQSDHKPLLSIMEKPIHQIGSTRLQRIRLKLSIYDIKLQFIPGSKLVLADAISRAANKAEDKELDTTLNYAVHTLNMSDDIRKKCIDATEKDEVLKVIKGYYYSGWPQLNKVPQVAKRFYNIKDDICVEDGVVFYRDRVIVPTILRPMILDNLHKTHFGITKTVARAKTLFFWFGMSEQIEKWVKECDICEKYANKNVKEPLITTPLPELPFQIISSDILEFGGVSYLVVYDYYSKWLEVDKINSKNASSIIEVLKTKFSTHGIPQILRADNMPFSSMEMLAFAREWCFKIVTSSPNYSQSNGFAEKGVQIVKNMLKKGAAGDLNMVLLEYRNTPVLNSQFSPAQLLFNRRTRTQLPIRDSLLKPEIVRHFQEVQEKKNRQNEKYYNRSAKKSSYIYKEGQEINFHDGDGKWKRAKVIGFHSTPRSVIIQDENNRIKRRNTKFIKPSFRKSKVVTEKSASTKIPMWKDEMGRPEEMCSESHQGIGARPVRNRRLPKYLDDYEL